MLGGALSRLEVSDKVERLPKKPEGEPNSKEKLNHQDSLSDLADLVNCFFGCTSLQTENLEAALVRFAAVTTVRKEIAIVEHVDCEK
jgi:hypothetical protein